MAERRVAGRLTAAAQRWPAAWCTSTPGMEHSEACRAMSCLRFQWRGNKLGLPRSCRLTYNGCLAPHFMNCPHMFHAAPRVSAGTELTLLMASWLLIAPFAAAQPASHVNPKSTSDQVFKNVQVLKGIPVDDFLGTMGIMCAALGFDCSECHTGAGTVKVDWAADNPRKLIT